MSVAVLGYVSPMVKEGSKGKPTAARFALASNLKHLMDTYSKGFAVGISPSELQKGSGVNAKTIRRVINPYSDTGPSLETIDALADFFHVQAWELLVPRPAALHGADTGPTVHSQNSAPSKRK